MTRFKGCYYCMWQQSACDEDTPDTGIRYARSIDGQSWSRPAPVLMADGTPVDGIFEQDPMMLPERRTVGAVHFRPGYQVVPVYTDDPSGVRG